MSAREKLSPAFWRFWLGQAVSSLGSAITTFAFPLIVFKRTGSPIDLSFATAATFGPYLIFGLVMGAWADRVDRRRLMMGADVARALLIASVPLAESLGYRSSPHLYAVIFAASTLTIAFNAAQVGLVPAIVPREQLLVANARVMASNSAATVLGPVLAGALVAMIPAERLLYMDALSFVVSAATLVTVRCAIPPRPARTTTLRSDVASGLRYVLGSPVLRSIAAMTGILSFVGITVEAQIVLFASKHLAASDSEISLIFSAGGVGVLLLSLVAGPLGKRWSFSAVAMTSVVLKGLVMALLGLTRSVWLALPLWALSEGLPLLFSLNTTSLRQTIVPPELLGRVQTIGQVIAWSSIPLGTLVGGFLIERTGRVDVIFTAIGVINLLIGVAFVWSPLGRAERYHPELERRTPAYAGEGAQAT